MRILHVLDHSLPKHSGYTFRTLAILREQRALGWETLQLTSPRQGTAQAEFEDVDGLRFHRTPLHKGFGSAVPGVEYAREMRATAQRINDLVRMLDPDIIHAHSPVLNALPALSVGRRLGVPVVYELRAPWEDAAVDHGTTTEGSIRYRATRALETYVLRHAGHITTICEGLRREISGRGIPAERITVIPNAVDTRDFRFEGMPDAILRAKLGLDDAGVSNSRALGGEVIGAGKYLSPRLFVGYGVSLVGAGQVVTLKYLLRKGFDIEIESSTVENRASVNWRLER